MDTLAANDGRLPHEKIERIRQLRPDMLLLAGGTDGGTISHVVELAEYIAAADPKPRFGSGFMLPVIFAGNQDACKEVVKVLGEKTDLTVAENIRPVLEEENLAPARHVIHDLFLEHVMAQAPGYRKLMGWTGAPIMPTPAAVGEIMQTIARQQAINVVGVDIVLRTERRKALKNGLGWVRWRGRRLVQRLAPARLVERVKVCKCAADVDTN